MPTSRVAASRPEKGGRESRTEVTEDTEDFWLLDAGSRLVVPIYGEQNLNPYPPDLRDLRGPLRAFLLRSGDSAESLNNQLKLSTETNQRIEALEGEVEKIGSRHAQQVAGPGQARHAAQLELKELNSRVAFDSDTDLRARMARIIRSGYIIMRYNVNSWDLLLTWAL